MSILSGLLGGFSLPNTQPQTGLLGQYYSPTEMARQKQKAGLLQAGLALLSQQPRVGPKIGLGESFGTALRAGLEGAQQAQADYMQNALMGYNMDRQAKDDAWQAKTRERQQHAWDSEDQANEARKAFYAALPEDQRQLAEAYPEQFGKLYAEAQLKKAFPEVGGKNEYGLNPVVVQNPDTLEYQLLQPSKDGSPPKVIPLPEGFKYAPATRTINTGTEFQTLPTKGAPVPSGAPLPINIQGKAVQEALGENQGKQIASAPGDMQAAQLALDTIAQIRSNSYIDRGTGASSMFNAIPGTGGYDFQNLVDQAKSGAFLTAIQQMRGLGSLSNAEGEGATKAVTRMNTATSKEAFLKALDDYEAYVKKGYNRAASRVGAPALPEQGSPLGNDPLGLR